MMIFLSWSGVRSGGAAKALKQWLPDVLPGCDTWMSATDVHAGTRWGDEIARRLDECSFGISCLTPENVARPWINFEAGAIAKHVSEARLIPYVLGEKPSDLPIGPLTQYQGRTSDQEGTWDVVKSINSVLVAPVPEDRLRRVFERSWPDLERSLIEAEQQEPNTTPAPGPNAEDRLLELTGVVKDLRRMLLDIRPLADPTYVSHHVLGRNLAGALRGHLADEIPGVKSGWFTDLGCVWIGVGEGAAQVSQPLRIYADDSIDQILARCKSLVPNLQSLSSARAAELESRPA